MQEFCEKKPVACGVIFFLGALREGALVTGPEEAVIPPVPHFELISNGWEVFGMGTILPGGTRPMMHVHASCGKKQETRTGCLRERAEVYLVVEAVVLEIQNLAVRRLHDEKTQLHLPVIGDHSAGEG